MPAARLCPPAMTGAQSLRQASAVLTACRLYHSSCGLVLSARLDACSWVSIPSHRVRRHLPFEDVWALFGEGRHPHIQALFERSLGPWLSQAAFGFWSERLWYFQSGLYYQGGMVRSSLPLGVCHLPHQSVAILCSGESLVGRQMACGPSLGQASMV